MAYGFGGGPDWGPAGRAAPQPVTPAAGVAGGGAAPTPAPAARPQAAFGSMGRLRSRWGQGGQPPMRHPQGMQPPGAPLAQAKPGDITPSPMPHEARAVEPAPVPMTPGFNPGAQMQAAGAAQPAPPPPGPVVQQAGTAGEPMQFDRGAMGGEMLRQSIEPPAPDANTGGPPPLAGPPQDQSFRRPPPGIRFPRPYSPIQ